MLSFTTEQDSRHQSRYQAIYQSIVRIGRGGMAEVMLAAMQGSGVTKLVVLKCLWPELAEDPGYLEMFLDEARLCARLTHPNVVQTYEVLRHGGRLAMSMEYLEGQPLTRVLTRLVAELGLPTRLRIITGVLAGLEYAHTLTDFDGAPLHVVHRDVSPHNVFVTYDGHIKLLDFGIAKTMAARHQTQPGGVKGKMGYLAPEALRGDAVDRRSDLFSVGVMLWEIIAGRRLWDHKREAGQPWCLAPDASPPELPADLDVPDALRAVCRRALALEPEARYQSAAELGGELERFGALASDSHARHLGQLVSRTFAAERIQRRGLIDFHLRSDLDAPASPPDYDSFEISPAEPSESDLTIVHERRVGERRALPETPAAGASPAPVAASPAPSRRGHGWSRTALIVGAAAVLALVSGTRLGPVSAAWPAAKTWLVQARASAIAAGLARMEASEAAESAPVAIGAEAAPVPKVERLAPAEPAAAMPRAEHRERRPPARRPHPVDLSDDDVLDIDGSPLPPSRGSGVSRDSDD
jgi:serine/threonine protein kinase